MPGCSRTCRARSRRLERGALRSAAAPADAGARRHARALLPAALGSPTETRSGLRLIEQLPSEPQPDGRRVTALVIGASALAVLTTWLTEKGVNPARFSVRAIGTYGFRLSPHWTQLIERAWRARVFDNY